MNIRLLHVLDCSIPNLSGYSIRSKYTVELQNKFGLRPLVLTSPNMRGEKKEELINNIPYIRCSQSKLLWNNFERVLPYMGKIIVVKALYKEILGVTERNAIHLIHAHSPLTCGIPALKVARALNVPFVYEVRALWEDAAVEQGKTTVDSIRYKLTRHSETKLLNSSDAIVTICEGLRREILLRGIPEEKVWVVPNGVDSSFFTPLPKDKSMSTHYRLQDRLTIGFIGSFFNFEGLKVLLKALPLIQREVNNVKLLLVGDGEDMGELRKLTREIGMEKDVLFAGKVPHETVTHHYSVMDILIYPRLKKRITDMVTPLKPLEAMSMEKAVIASNVNGLKELVEDGKTGLLFQAEDVQHLAQKCIILCKNAKLREKLGKQARVHVVNERNWAKIIPKYISLYQSLLKINAMCD